MTSLPARVVTSVHGVSMTIVGSRMHPDARPPFQQPRVDGSHLTAAGPRLLSQRVRGSNGRGLCRWCWGEIPKPRLSWCSGECICEYRSNCDWGVCRWQCFERDAGVCQECFVDVAWLQQVHAKLRYPFREMNRFDEWRQLGRRLSGLQDTCRDWWEADHITARADGGPDHFSNLRVLCIRCHKARTRTQAKERAEKRRAQRADLFTGRREAE